MGAAPARETFQRRVDEAMQALAYFGSASRLLTDVVHHGPLAAYTEAHQALYRKHL